MIFGQYRQSAHVEFTRSKIITFPAARAAARDKKLYLRRGEVVQLASRRAEKISSGERLAHMHALSFGDGINIIAGEDLCAGDFVTSGAIKVTGVIRHAQEYRDKRLSRYQLADTVQLRDEGYYGTVIGRRTRDEKCEAMGTTIAVREYLVDFHGIRDWYGAEYLKMARPGRRCQ